MFGILRVVAMVAGVKKVLHWVNPSTSVSHDTINPKGNNGRRVNNLFDHTRNISQYVAL